MRTVPSSELKVASLKWLGVDGLDRCFVEPFPMLERLPFLVKSCSVEPAFFMSPELPFVFISGDNGDKRLLVRGVDPDVVLRRATGEAGGLLRPLGDGIESIAGRDGKALKAALLIGIGLRTNVLFFWWFSVSASRRSMSAMDDLRSVISSSCISTRCSKARKRSSVPS